MVSLDTASAGKEPLTAEAHQPRATNEPDKHQPIDTSRPVSRVLPIAERFMRKRLLQIASSPFNHDKKEAFTNVELRTDELIDVLALSSREERLGFVKDILDLAFQRKDAAIFFAKKAYNILGHTSHEEQQRIVDHIYAQSGSRDLKASLLHILLNNPRNLKDFQRLCAYAVPKRAKKLGCVHILEVFADAELSPARRAVDFTRRCGKTASLSLVKKRLVEIRDGIDELIQVVKNSPYKETEVAAATLRIAQRAKREVVAELQSNAKLSTKIDRYNLIAQRLDFELKYNYALTNTNGKKAATWDLKEIEAVREVFRGIENKFGSWILRLMPIHEIKRVGELPTKAGYTHQAYMDEYGLMEVSDAARWDDSESKTGDNIPRFKHKIAHEAGHALQYPYSYEWANRSGSRTGLLRLYPVQNIEFLPWMTAAWDEHVQLSDWVKLQQDRYKVRPHKTKDGLVITIDGEDYEQGAIVRIGHRDYQIFYDGTKTKKDSTLWLFNPKAVFPKVDHARWGGEEEFPDAFAEIIGGVKFKNRVTDQKIEHFRRKFAGHKRKKGSVGKSLVALPRRFAPAIERALEDRSSDHLPARSSHGADAEFSAPATTVYRPVGTNGNVSSLGVQISRADDLALKLLRVLPVEVQAGILAGSLYETGNGSSKTSYNDIFLEGKECSQMERNRIALGALVYADKAERFWQGLRTAHRDTLPSVFLAHYGLLRGDDIALVDAKPNKDAHRDLLQMVNYGLGAQIPNSNSYFLLDEGRNVRLHRALESRIKALKIGESKASEMKTHPAPWFAAIVAVDFLRGFYIDADGAQRALQQQYDRVVLYHPDKETRELTRVLASEAEVKHRLSVGDPNACRFSNLWGKLQDLTSESSSPPHPQRPKVLRFLALEGGLVNTGAATRFFIGDTQDEIHREHAPLTTFDLNKLRARVASEHGLEAAQLRVDDADFTDEYRIRSLLANERLFRVR